MTRRLGEKLVQLTLLVLLLSFYLATVQSGMRYPSTTDFAKFYSAAQFAREGRDIYAPVRVDALGPLPPKAEITRQTLHPNLNLPVLTTLFLPFTGLSYRAAFLIWSVLSLFCGFLALLLVSWTVEGRIPPLRRTVWLVILLLGYYPVWVTVKLGQVSLVLFLLFAIGWTAARHQKDTVAGIAIGLALLLKVFALILVLYFGARRRWKLAGWSLIVFVAGLVISLAVFGVTPHLRYLVTLRSITWYGANWNASLFGFLTRILGGTENIPAIDAPWLAKGLAYGVSTALVGLLIWLVWRRRGDNSSFFFDLGFGLSLVIMLLAAPLGWMYYFPVLFIPFFAAGSVVGDRRHSGLRYGLILAYCLSTSPLPLVASSNLNSPIAWFTWAAVYCYALILTGGILAIFVRRYGLP